MSGVQTITAQKRERAGKGAARAIRREGRIPAVVYGNKKDPEMISLDPIEMMKHLRGAFFTHVYEINIEGGAKERVLARDVQNDPVSDRTMHIDFMRFSAATKINVEVECQFINEEECPGLGRGGVLNVVRYTVEFMCSPESIPDHITVDLAGLDIGDSVHISAVSLPEGVTPVISDRDFTIATIAAPTAVVDEQREAAEAAAAAEGVEAAEGEGEGGDAKPAEGDGGKDGGKGDGKAAGGGSGGDKK
ncbi:MAG: 50S ribosomal protein L25/general stress protein Ctc [Rhodospirillales bacterium]